MKKKIVMVIIIIIIISLFIMTGCNLSKKNDIPTDLPKDVIKSLKKLPSSERRNINYVELNEDIKSLKNDKSLKYAKNNSKKEIYNGNGYYVKVIWGGEEADYFFYSYGSNTKFYVVQVLYPMTSE